MKKRGSSSGKMESEPRLENLICSVVLFFHKVGRCEVNKTNKIIVLYASDAPALKRERYFSAISCF